MLWRSKSILVSNGKIKFCKDEHGWELLMSIFALSVDWKRNVETCNLVGKKDRGKCFTRVESMSS